MGTLLWENWSGNTPLYHWLIFLILYRKGKGLARPPGPFTCVVILWCVSGKGLGSLIAPPPSTSIQPAKLWSQCLLFSQGRRIMGKVYCDLYAADGKPSFAREEVHKAWRACCRNCILMPVPKEQLTPNDWLQCPRALGGWLFAGSKTLSKCCKHSEHSGARILYKLTKKNTPHTLMDGEITDRHDFLTVCKPQITEWYWKNTFQLDSL